VESVNGRQGIDSLAGVVRSVLNDNPLSGDLLFIKNRAASAYFRSISTKDSRMSV
jgi:hypothetical protein